MKNKIVFGIFAMGLLASAPSAWAQTVTVNPSTTYQTISGFGASSQWDNSFSSSLANTFWADDSSQPPSSQVNGNVGLSILRLGIDDSGNANWGTQCAFATQALGINSKIKVFGSEWSPPAKWKNNNSVDGNNTGNDNGNPGSNTNQLNTADYANYAAYQTSFVTACKNTYGFTLTALSVQNEPDYDPSYDACLWSPSAFDTYIKNNLGPDLEAAGFGTSIIMMPESFADNLNLSATTMGDSAAASFVGFIGMHLYGGGPNTVPTSYSTTAGHAVESWETEISEKTSDNNIDSGIYYADLLHSCIVDHNFNAFCYWWLVNINSDDEGLCTSAGTPTPRLYCIGNFSKFIRPGFVRIGCTESPSAGVSVSAYYGASTGKVVVVAINSNTSSYSLPVSYTGLTVSTVYPWLTDSSSNLVQQTSITPSNGSFTYSLPGQSVVSFVASVSSSSNPTATFTPTAVPPTPTHTNTPIPPTATPTSTATKTNTPVPPTATATSTATSTASSTFTATHTNTPVPPTATPSSTATSTSTATHTNTPVPPTSTSTNTFTSTRTNTPVPPTATSTNTPVLPTATFTSVPPTATNSPIPPTATFTAVPPTSTNTAAPPTLTNTPVPPTATNTAAPPTATNTSIPPTATFSSTPVSPTSTNTPVPPTATFTFTAVPPTATNTSVPPTATFTHTAVPPTNTFTQVPSTATFTFTMTPVPPTATNTPVPPTFTSTHTPVPPTSTPTFTAVPPTATFTSTPVPPTATDTPTAVVSSTSFEVQLLSAVTSANTNSPHPQLQIVNAGTGPLNLNNVTVKYWFNCDCTTQTLQAWVDWAGLIPEGTSETGNVHVSVQPTSLGGQTDYVLYSFSGNIVLPPGGILQIQSRFNKSDWSNMNQDNDWSFHPNTNYQNDPQATGYLGGALVWGEEPVSKPAALTVASAMSFPNPSTGNGATLSFVLNGTATGVGASLDSNNPLLLDPNAKITLSIYTLAMRLIWTQTLTGGAYGTTGQHDLYWNEKDLKGTGLANGVYLLKVTVVSNGQTSSTIAKILILG